MNKYVYIMYRYFIYDYNYMYIIRTYMYICTHMLQTKNNERRYIMGR